MSNKNIHVLSTGITIAGIETKKIHITSDEEIKEGDWCLDEKENIVKADKDFIFNCSHEFDEYWKKIILTTDQDLIKDGVQAIDDEFLEWFVKNPSCEEVEVEYNEYEIFGNKSKKWIDSHSCYKIIIQKEESKQETLEEAAEKFAKKFSSEIDSTRYYAFINGAKWQQEQDKNKFSEEDIKLSFEAGHKKGFSGYPNTENWKELPFEEWFEKFKNK